MLHVTDIKCKPFIATKVVDGVTYTLRIARANDRPSTIIRTSDGRYFRDINTYFNWGTGALDNEIIAEQINWALRKIGASLDIFHDVWIEVTSCDSAYHSAWNPWSYPRFDFLLINHFGYSISEVDNMNEAQFEKFIKSKQESEKSNQNK